MARKKPPHPPTTESLLPESPLGPLYRLSGQSVLMLKADVHFDQLELTMIDQTRFKASLEGIAYRGEPNIGWLYALLAGPIAERMHSDVWNLAPDDEDITRLARFLARMPEGDPRQAHGRTWEALCAVEETRDSLWYRWSAVESVVAELRARKCLPREAIANLVTEPTVGVRPPLVPKPDEILAELEIVLRQNHGISLGDWRACPREAPMPQARVERRSESR